MNQSNTIKELPSVERPYEKCMQSGPESLSDIELLAVLLRTGTKGENALELSRRILYDSGEEGILAIHHFSLPGLLKMKGIGRVKAIQILCLSELAKRLAKASAKKLLKFSSPASIADYYMEDLRHEGQEIVKLLMLNTKAELISETNISRGTVNASLITPRELLVEALKQEAVSIILLHNHPSGDPTPSEDDRMITRRVAQAGALVGIDLLDHIVIGNNTYYSFREERLLENA